MSLGFLRGQAALLHPAGLDVHAISSPGPELARFGADENVPVRGVEMARSITPVRDLVSLWGLWRALREIRPMIVDAHTAKAGLLGMIAAALAGTPIRVLHLHGLRFVTTSGWRRRLLRFTDRASCALADRVIAVSPSVRAMAVEEGLCPPDRITVLLGGTVNGVDANTRFHPQPAHVRSAARAEHGIPGDAPVVGFVGRLARDKGLVELAAAWRELRRDPSVHLLLVGPEDASDAPPPEILADLRVDPRVHMTGYVLDPIPSYAAIDVLALPTYREGFPQVALEGGAMGMPIVATAVCGCVDAVRDGFTGALVPPRDARALADALRKYLDDPALRAEHGANARRRIVAEFDRNAVCAALAAEYQRLIRRACAGRGGGGTARRTEGAPR